jgi:FtsH-binding integral membrane protein
VQITSIFGYKDSSPDFTLVVRLFGGALLAWALIGWFGRNVRDAAGLRGVLIAGVIGHVVGVVVTVFGILSGILNALAWPIALAYLFGAVGAAYFLMARSHNS